MDKECLICLKVLEITKFPTGYRTKSGYGPYCKKCNSAKRRSWRQMNRSRANAQQLDYVRRNPQMRKRWTANYRAANLEYLREQFKEWRRTRPGLHAQSEAKRRSLKRKTGVDLAGVQSIYDLSASDQRVTCAYCEKITEQGSRHVDHKTPLSRGGTHSSDNLVICCVTCNLRKGTKTADEFAEEVCHRR